jgi:hypothetical protein
MLEELLGRSVEVSPCAPWAPIGAEIGTIAVSVDDSLVVRAVGLCDLPFSAYAGAAIGLLPADVASEAVADKTVSPTIAENLYEILNIASALYNVDDHPHMRLYQVHHIGEPAPPEVQALGGVLGQRLDLSVRIAGYGEGRLSLVGVA